MDFAHSWEKGSLTGTQLLLENIGMCMCKCILHNVEHCRTTLSTLISVQQSLQSSLLPRGLRIFFFQSISAEWRRCEHRALFSISRILFTPISSDSHVRFPPPVLKVTRLNSGRTNARKGAAVSPVWVFQRASRAECQRTVRIYTRPRPPPGEI